MEALVWLVYSACSLGHTLTYLALCQLQVPKIPGSVGVVSAGEKQKGVFGGEPTAKRAKTE